MNRASCAFGVLLVTVLSSSASVAFADPSLAREIREATLAVDASPEDVELRFVRMDLYRRAERFDDALADVRLVEAMAPRDPRARLARGEILDDAGRSEEAAALLDAFVATRPAPRLAFRAWVRLAHITAAAGRIDDALRAYDEALEAHGDVQIHLERAELLVEHGRGDEAISALEAGVHELAGAVVLRETLVEALVRARRFDEAVAHATELVRGADVPTRPLLLRADVLEAAGRSREAGADRERALREARASVARRPSARAVYLRGAALLALGRTDEARRDLVSAVTRAPHMADARTALARANRAARTSAAGGVR